MDDPALLVFDDSFKRPKELNPTKIFSGLDNALQGSGGLMLVKQKRSKIWHASPIIRPAPTSVCTQ